MGSEKTGRKKNRRRSIRRALFFLFAALLIIAGVFLYPSMFSVTGFGQGKKLLESRESLYNNIFVYSFNKYVLMTFGYNSRIYVESIYDTQDDMDLPVPYTRFMGAGLMYAKNIKSILSIGFGGGRTDWYLHRSMPNVRVTSVDLDSDVIKLAEKYFGIREEPNFHIDNQDGRMFLAESNDKYDMILIDAYRGPFVPFHLLTKEFYQLVKDHLAEGGVVVQNVESTTMLFDSAVRTINAVFPQVNFYPSGENVVIVAYDGAPKSADELRTAADRLQEEYNFRYDPHMQLQNRQPMATSGKTVDPHAKVMTDDFAPVESLKAIENHNRKWPDPQTTKP